MKRILPLLSLILTCLLLCSCGSDGTPALSIHKSPSLAGDWYTEYMPRDFIGPCYSGTLTLNEDKTYVYGDKTGSWSLSNDETELILTGEEDFLEYTFNIFEEDGFTKILCCDELYIRADDYPAFFEQKYLSESAPKLIGDWVFEFIPGRQTDTLTLNEDQTFRYGTHLTGCWYTTDDYSELYLVNEEGIIQHIFQIFEEDGFTKIWEDYEIYIHADNYETSFEKKYVKIRINSLEYMNALGDFKFVGYPDPSWSDMPTAYYLFDSVAYNKDGLLYAGHSENFIMTVIFHNDKFAVPCDITSPFDLLAFNRYEDPPSTFDVEIAVGYVYYVRPEYVDNIYYDENGSRVLSLTLGNEIETCFNSPWELMPDVDPYDFPM